MNDTAMLPPPPVDTEAQASLFQRLRWQMFRNSMRNVGVTTSLRIIPIIVFSVAVWVCVFAASWSGFHFLHEQELSQRLPFLKEIIGFLFDLMFLCLALFLVFSGGIILYGSLFTTPETAFLLATSARADQVFSYKFQGAIAFSSWAFVLLGIPVLLGYGVEFSAPWYFYALLPLFSLGFVLLPGSCGAMLCLLIVNFIPAQPKKLAIRSGIVMALIVIWRIVYLFREVRGTHWTQDDVTELLNQFSFASGYLMPSHWMTQGLMAAQRADLEQTVYRLVLVISNGLFFYLLTAWLARRLYRRGYNRLATGGSLRRRYGGGWLDRSVNTVLAFLDPQTRLMMIKDFRTFRRDPTQWAQLLIFLGLLLLYIGALQRFYREDLTQDIMSRLYRNGVSLINVAATALLICAYTSRFIYPMLSLEGRKFWILGLLPLKRERLLWGKFAFSATWALLASGSLILVSDVMLRMPLPIIGVHVLTEVAIALGLSGICVGLGAAMPNFRETDASRIAIGAGGMLNLVACLLFIVVEVTLLTAPWHLRLQSREIDAVFRIDAWTTASMVLGLILGAVAVIVPMRMGARVLRQMEF